MALERIVKPHIRELDPYRPGKPAEELDRELAASGARSEPQASEGLPASSSPAGSPHGWVGSLKLASNESPLGPSPRAVAALQGALAGVHRYPDGASFGLRRKLAQRLGVDGEQLVFGAGADEILELLAKILLGPGDECVFAWPSFAMYPIVVQGMGARSVQVPLDADLVHDLPAMARAIGPRTRLVFVCNPNNPTGTSVGREAFDRFAAELPPDLVLAIDEAYVDFARRPDFPDALAWVRRRPGTIALRTFSKASGLAGLRIGYGVADPELAGYLQRARHPFNVNRLAEVAAEAALDDREYTERLRRLTSEGIEYLTRELRALGFEVWPSDANFLLAKPGSGWRKPAPRTPQASEVSSKPAPRARSGPERPWSSAEASGVSTDGGVFDQLLREGVIVRPLGGFGMPEHVRITIGLPEENERLVKALQRIAERAE